MKYLLAISLWAAMLSSAEARYPRRYEPFYPQATYGVIYGPQGETYFYGTQQWGSWTHYGQRISTGGWASW